MFPVSADSSGQDPGSRQKHKFETNWLNNQTDHKCQPAKNSQGNRMNMSHSEKHVFHHCSYSFPPLRVSSLAAKGVLLRTVASCPEPSTHYLYGQQMGSSKWGQVLGYKFFFSNSSTVLLIVGL